MTGFHTAYLKYPAKDCFSTLEWAFNELREASARHERLVSSLCSRNVQSFSHLLAGERPKIDSANNVNGKCQVWFRFDSETLSTNWGLWRSSEGRYRGYQLDS